MVVPGLDSGYIGMSNKGMMQRCWEHDYCAPCFYMITVMTEPRRECLGEVVNPGAGAAPGTGQAGGAAFVEMSTMGEAVGGEAGARSALRASLLEGAGT